MTRDINADPFRLQRSAERKAARAGRPKRRSTREVVLDQVDAERHQQDEKWGGARHDDDHQRADWVSFIKDHLDRATKAAPHDMDEYRQQLLEIAALAVAGIESHDRKQRRARRKP